jgi:uncharacterized protein YbjT (DUF2867 family)
MVEQNGPRPVAVIVGTDNWLRPRVVERLVAGGMRVRDLGRGSATLSSVDVLVALPALAPRSGSADRDVGVEAAQITFGAVLGAKLQQFVMVSRVGSDPKAKSSYLAALGNLERRASNASSRLTVIRVAHPFGPPDDAGPMVKSMLTVDRSLSDDQHGPAVQPVFVDDVANLVADAAFGGLGSGLIELGGPDTMPLSQFAASGRTLGSRSGRASRPLLPPSRRRLDDAVEATLACDSVASRKLAPPPRALRRLSDVWGDVRVTP